MVERHLAKVRVAGSNPVFRSFLLSGSDGGIGRHVGLKIQWPYPGRAGSSPAPSTQKPLKKWLLLFNYPNEQQLSLYALHPYLDYFIILVLMDVNKGKQSLNLIFILLGGGLLLYDLTQESTNVYISTIGLVLLMFGLYKSTRQWVNDNPKDDDQQNSDKNGTQGQ